MSHFLTDEVYPVLFLWYGHIHYARLKYLYYTSDINELGYEWDIQLTKIAMPVKETSILVPKPTAFGFNFIYYYRILIPLWKFIGVE